MALRNFQDENGSEWRVWDVVPQRLQGRPERRQGERRRQGGVHAYSGPERRGGEDRRRGGLGSALPGLGTGWLCFENGDEKRRLSPIPLGWDETSDDELAGLLARAHPVPRRMECEAPLH